MLAVGQTRDCDKAAELPLNPGAIRLPSPGTRPGLEISAKANWLTGKRPAFSPNVIRQQGRPCGGGADREMLIGRYGRQTIVYWHS